MAGTSIAVGVVGVTAALAVGLLAVGGAAVQAQRVAGAADAAALAAADAASGVLSGVPCERAEQLAATIGAELVRCELDDLIATVTVEGRVLGLPVSASARAGPPAFP
ncbi:MULTISPECIES: Rv3654c family TadE-like protein [unclassified Microbacterium]|uniref:Rv3654c family TadE-like protein n=1 Tax=unclassified Microbacterium TaxID=2609290 RepID=UPI000F55436E|nr:Rv3654c family TadE-like protein [Microbacterium sp. ABRD28]AZC14559.1 helicase [Microbacterium sp. ABRD28]